MTIAGFFSGAMIAVLVAKIRGSMMHCTPVDPELPACNWEAFAGVGGIIGAVSLPALVLWQVLRGPRRRGDGAARDDAGGGRRGAPPHGEL